MRTTKMSMMMAAALYGMTAASPIFGQANNLIKAGQEQRLEKRKHRTIKRHAARNSRIPHIGAKQIRKRAGKQQYPEFLAIEARNLASGKWA